MPNTTSNTTSSRKPPSSAQRPTPRPYAPPKEHERVSRHPTYPEPPQPQAAKKSALSRLWPFKPSSVEAFDYTKQDPARGIEASRRVVREGVLDTRYARTARLVTVILSVTPVALYLTWELYQRRFGGREQKAFPMHKAKRDEHERQNALDR